MHNGGTATWVRASHREARRVREKQDKRNEAVHVCHVREKCCTVKNEMKFITVQSQTNKVNNLDILGRSEYFGNIFSESCSTLWNMSKNTPPKIFPRAVTGGQIFDQNFQSFDPCYHLQDGPWVSGADQVRRSFGSNSIRCHPDKT